LVAAGLAIQASNATLTVEQRGYLNKEFQQLKQEINRINSTENPDIPLTAYSIEAIFAT
jgi:hypothetical protein